jgi:hypothetical protein
MKRKIHALALKHKKSLVKHLDKSDSQMDISITSVSGVCGINAATPLDQANLNLSLKDEKFDVEMVSDNNGTDLNKSALSGIMATPNKATKSTSSPPPAVKVKSEIKTPPTIEKPTKSKKKTKKCKQKRTKRDYKKKPADKYAYILQGILFDYLETKANLYGNLFSSWSLSFKKKNYFWAINIPNFASAYSQPIKK